MWVPGFLGIGIRNFRGPGVSSTLATNPQAEEQAQRIAKRGREWQQSRWRLNLQGGSYARKRIIHLDGA